MDRLSTPVFQPGEFHGLYSPWGHKESDMTEQLSLSNTFGQDCSGVVPFLKHHIRRPVRLSHEVRKLGQGSDYWNSPFSKYLFLL